MAYSAEGEITRTMHTKITRYQRLGVLFLLDEITRTVCTEITRIVQRLLDTYPHVRLPHMPRLLEITKTTC